MGDFKQFLEEMQTNEELCAQFRAGINKCREEKDLDQAGAILKTAKSLGYELTEEEVKELVENRIRKSDASSKDGELSDEELDAAAGGGDCSCCYHGIGSSHCAYCY